MRAAARYHALTLPPIKHRPGSRVAVVRGDVDDAAAAHRCLLMVEAMRLRPERYPSASGIDRVIPVRHAFLRGRPYQTAPAEAQLGAALVVVGAFTPDEHLALATALNGELNLGDFRRRVTALVVRDTDPERGERWAQHYAHRMLMWLVVSRLAGSGTFDWRDRSPEAWAWRESILADPVIQQEHVQPLRDEHDHWVGALQGAQEAVESMVRERAEWAARRAEAEQARVAAEAKRKTVAKRLKRRMKEAVATVAVKHRERTAELRAMVGPWRRSQDPDELSTAFAGRRVLPGAVLDDPVDPEDRAHAVAAFVGVGTARDQVARVVGLHSSELLWFNAPKEST